MPRSIYLINPAADFPSYFNSEVLENHVGHRVAHVVALALPTVAAMVPPDFEVEICDECAEDVDLDHGAEIIGLTGMINQWSRMKELAQEFRRRGKVVMIGGPQASLRPDVVRPHCDILVRGEIEGIASEIFADLRAGRWKPEYVGDRPDLHTSPLPRMDLYPNGKTLVGAVQTSRGCPFHCEFCDVIQYNGRLQRHKPVGQVIAELTQLYARGYRTVFITDDNLTVHRKRVRELLAAIRDWNRGNEEAMAFTSQVSIDAAADPELLALCRDANLTEVFVGIETPNTDSLKEVGKNHNVKVDMRERVATFNRHGISVIGGMIVGFDSDTRDIFRQQYEFAMSLPIPVFTAATLFAPETTPLYRRLAAEGRVQGGSSDYPCRPWVTNVTPLQMSKEELAQGLVWLLNRLYEPRAFATRLLHLMDNLGANPSASRRSPLWKMRPLERKCLGLLRRIPGLGFAETRMLARVLLKMCRRPATVPCVISYLLSYLQIRHMFDRGGIWRPEGVACPSRADAEAASPELATAS